MSSTEEKVCPICKARYYYYHMCRGRSKLSDRDGRKAL